jgi:hypothetical protein
MRITYVAVGLLAVIAAMPLILAEAPGQYLLVWGASVVVVFSSMTLGYARVLGRITRTTSRLLVAAICLAVVVALALITEKL